MDSRLFYIVISFSIIAAVALWLQVRPGRLPIKVIAGLVGLAAFGGLLANVSMAVVGETARPEGLFLIFSLIAIASAVRMITHSRPIYSALYFILVVLSSAALFLLLEAEFMAFAMVIVYAGAILITYMFVLMLAQQSSDPDHSSGGAEYDVNPREPAYASVVAFIMLALLTSMIYESMTTMPKPPTPTESLQAAWEKLDSMPLKRDEAIARVAPGAQVVPDEEGRAVRFREGQAYIEVIPVDSNLKTQIMLADEDLPSNVELVGLDLVGKFPVSLELAGVILLMAMYGAVVLARRQIELTEDEVREAAGMTLTSFEALEAEATGGESQ